MTNTQMLTRHRDIQNWVSGRHGMPAIVRRPTDTGRMKSELALRFRQPANPGNVDQEMSPVSWNAWLSEFDRRQLALKVISDNEFELIERKNLN
ncbi:MAG TPA: hypothetical protein VG757_15145 [Devosia sp.]|nr:hypothetical protein [Devosia sp.]